MMNTEQRNPRTLDLDLLEIPRILERINDEDRRVPDAVRQAIPSIARTVEGVAERLSGGGRLFYVGSGTSGRLGVLDAVECPPTFGVPPDLVQGVLAGGYAACHGAVEGVEDDPQAAETDLRDRGLTEGDAVVGIAASGRTPYTVAAVRFARSLGAFTAAVTCNRETLLAREAEVAVEVVVGPEVIAGSTRMKAGTAQKLVLNMISTAVMVRLGHVYSNLMVNLQLTNRKLNRRAVRIVQEVAQVDEPRAEQALLETGDVKSAVLRLRRGLDPQAAQRLASSGRSLRSLLEE